MMIEQHGAHLADPTSDTDFAFRPHWAISHATASVQPTRPRRPAACRSAVLVDLMIVADRPAGREQVAIAASRPTRWANRQIAQLTRRRNTALHRSGLARSGAYEPQLPVAVNDLVHSALAF